MLRVERLAVLLAAMVLAMGPALPQVQAASAGKAHYVIGKPYQFDGVWYQPEVDDSYDKTGLANVYPAGRSGLGTTSGEAYDENAIAGAHKTLPLPCFVRVTNLANGKAITLRLNDRGPFVDDRIVELTPAAARALDIAGLAQVRVQIMAKESQALAAALGAGKDQGPQPAASITPVPAPVVKVTNLPLLNGTAMQPMKPVASPGATPPMPVVSAPAVAAPAVEAPAVQSPTVQAPTVQAPAPAAATIPLAIPLPPAPSTITPASTAPAPAVIAPAVTTPAATTPATTMPPASTPITPPKPSPAAATIATPPAAAPAVTIPAAATPVTPKAVPAVSVSITNAAAPATATPAAAQAIPVQLTSVPTAPANAGKVKPLPVDLPAQFFIQTGAFKSSAEADRLREKLAPLGPARIVPTRLGADPFNAVLLGPIPSMGDAQRLLKQITGMGYADAVLIIE